MNLLMESVKRAWRLSDRGKEVISEMDRLGMVIDVSHLGKRDFGI